MSRNDDAQAAIKGFYAAATGQGGWNQALDHLLAATGFDGAAFYVVDRTTRRPLASRWHRLDESFATEYIEHHLAHDPRAAQVFVPAPTRILYDYLHTPEAEIDRDPFYAWFQRSQHLRYYLGGQSRAGANLPLTLTLHRPQSRGHAERQDAEIFSHLLDHFEHAVQLQHALSLNATQAAIRLADQDHDAHGMVLLDRHLCVLHANAAAQRIAARGDALELAATGLSASTAAGAAQLARLLADARQGSVTQPLQLARPYGGFAYVITAWPIPAPDLLANHASVAVAVRILDPDAADTLGVARAAALLGLSKQETEVVALLVEGADPAEIAVRLALRPATVRTYLSAIYRKAGCNRQGALVGRIMSLAETLRR